MSVSMLFTGLNGALGLYSSVKGLFDSAASTNKQKRLLKRAKAEEDGWYKRNYYGNFLDDTASRAAIKRVENTMSRQSGQNRALSAIHGATLELSVARNEQVLRSMENVYTGLAANDSERKMRVDTAHRQNMQSLLAGEMNREANDERRAAALAAGGMNLLQNAILGVQWGKEEKR